MDLLIEDPPTGISSYGFTYDLRSYSVIGLILESLSSSCLSASDLVVLTAASFLAGLITDWSCAWSSSFTKKGDSRSVFSKVGRLWKLCCPPASLIFC